MKGKLAASICPAGGPSPRTGPDPPTANWTKSVDWTSCAGRRRTTGSLISMSISAVMLSRDVLFVPQEAASVRGLVAAELHHLAKLRKLWDDPPGVLDCTTLLGSPLVTVERSRRGADIGHEAKVAALRTVLRRIVAGIVNPQTRREATVYFGLDEEWRGAPLSHRRSAIATDSWRRGWEQQLITVVESDFMEAWSEAAIAKWTMIVCERLEQKGRVVPPDLIPNLSLGLVFVDVNVEHDVVSLREPPRKRMLQRGTPSVEALAAELHHLARLRKLWDDPLGVMDCSALLGLPLVRVERSRRGAGAGHEAKVAALRTVLRRIVISRHFLQTRRQAMIYFGLDDEWRGESLGDRQRAIARKAMKSWRRGGEQQLFTAVAANLRQAERRAAIARWTFHVCKRLEREGHAVPRDFLPEFFLGVVDMVDVDVEQHAVFLGEPCTRELSEYPPGPYERYHPDLGHLLATMAERYGRLLDPTVPADYERALRLAKECIGPDFRSEPNSLAVLYARRCAPLVDQLYAHAAPIVVSYLGRDGRDHERRLSAVEWDWLSAELRPGGSRSCARRQTFRSI